MSCTENYAAATYWITRTVEHTSKSRSLHSFYVSARERGAEICIHMWSNASRAGGSDPEYLSVIPPGSRIFRITNVTQHFTLHFTSRTPMYHAHSDHALMNTVKCDNGHANLQTRARAALTPATHSSTGGAVVRRAVAILPRVRTSAELPAAIVQVPRTLSFCARLPPDGKRTGGPPPRAYWLPFPSTFVSGMPENLAPLDIEEPSRRSFISSISSRRMSPLPSHVSYSSFFLRCA